MMNKIIRLCLLSAILSTCFFAVSAQDYKRIIDRCDIDLKKDFVKLNDSLLVYKYEVSNCRYKEFLAFLEVNEQAELKRMCSPKENWPSMPGRSDASKELFQKFYFQHSLYDHYPVVNISHRAALAFCAYLTEKFNEEAGADKYVVRLPTLGEYMEFSGLEQISKAEKNFKVLFTPNKYNFFFPTGGYDGSGSEKWFAITEAYKANRLGLYNCFGNVAEMLDDTEGAIGGSCFDKPIELPRDLMYGANAVPSPRVGFRVVVEKR
jgi:formylglycine-generating enzyme required for sulfatase activity